MPRLAVFPLGIAEIIMKGERRGEREAASTFALQSWGMEANLRCAAADDVGNFTR